MEQSLPCKDVIAALQWRGMIQDMSPGLQRRLQCVPIAGYAGFDLTAPSLHVGNLATIMLLKHLQLAGHHALAVIGGATTRIGDPSGKSAERPQLEESIILRNQARISGQLKKLLKRSNAEDGKVLINNLDWWQSVNFCLFLRDVGKHIPLGYMLAKESVKRRLKTGISFTEFTYQLLQGYDFYHLYRHHGVQLQVGGADQWGNLTTGAELIRRKTGKEVFALTTPLVTKTSGEKFGKTEQGAIWLDPTMTAPYTFYQFWLNSSDEDAKRWIKRFTLLETSAIEALIAQHLVAPHRRVLQRALAREVTTLVHTEQITKNAEKAAKILFNKDVADILLSLDEETLLKLFATPPPIVVSDAQFGAVEDILSLLTDVTQGKIFDAKAEACRMIKGGGVRINGIPTNMRQDTLSMSLLCGRYLLIQKGKKYHYLVEVR